MGLGFWRFLSIFAGMSSPASVILVIDDADETRYALSRYLKKAGFEVKEAADGKTGLALAQQIPALIILDVMLPDVSGFELARVLRNDPKTSRIPILQVSAAFTESTDKAEGLEGGADGYLVLPAEPDELVAHVRALLRLSRAEGSARQLADQWQATFDAINHAVCLVDAHGRIERYNQGFITFLGVVEKAIVGQSLEECLRQAGVADTSFLTGPFSGYAGMREVVLQANTFQISISPLGKNPEKKEGAICVFWDITSYLGYERRLLRDKQQLVEQLAAKTKELEDALSQRSA